MSLMTESLLLQAQSLRLEGELDESINLLRIVLSQCNSDLRAWEEAHREQKMRVKDDGRQYTDGDKSCGRGSPDGEFHSSNTQSSMAMDTTRRLRQMASYQLALLLLQRSGRGHCNYDGNVVDTPVSQNTDEHEADGLLWKLGYRLRLSKLAFGYEYPICSCRQGNTTQTSPVVSSCKIPLTVIDDALPVSVFDALKHAFRPESRYWSEFYCKANISEASQFTQSKPSLSQTDEYSEQRNINQFASHNIPLPRRNKAPPSSSISYHLQHSKSLLEQVAIITQQKLKERFPELENANSVEVWSHRRPPDGQHQLHYDMDEILLWKHRKGLTHSVDYEKEKNSDATTKRQKTCHEGDDKNYTNQIKDHTKLSQDDGVSCPIVSCVLTIDVPSQSGTCGNCKGIGTSAPTIICNQSITDCSGDNKSNTGYLCFPCPNRLLAFEGSLLHGVMPGIPFPRSSTASDDDESDSSDDMYELSIHNTSRRKPTGGNDQRITMMMGFWRDVCLTEQVKTTHSSITLEIGPNVPFGNLSPESWKDEFRPISGIDSGSANTIGLKDVVTLNPLWVPICNSVTPRDENGIGQYAFFGSFHGRFFLKSIESTDIDREVLHGE